MAEFDCKKCLHEKVCALWAEHECQDAAMIAAHDVLQLGPGRAEDFCIAYREAINDMARRVVDDQMDDPEFVYAKAKIDEQIRAIVGPEKFAPWEVRYGEKPV